MAHSIGLAETAISRVENGFQWPKCIDAGAEVRRVFKVW
jgi:hypothetical protein